MDWIEVLQRIQQGENEHTEFGRFRKLNEKDWRKAACAFANTEGGLIVLGVSDDGEIDGVPIDAEEVQERLTNALQNSLNQPIRAKLGRHRDPAGEVHWIQVARMRGPEPLRVDGRVLVRRGRANVEPETSELQELYNAFGMFLTEERAIPGTSVTDVDVSLFREFMTRKGIHFAEDDHIPIDIDLLNREILTRDFDDKAVVTLYGLLCFGIAPQDHAPTRNFCVDLVAYAGTDRSDPVLSSAQARGRLDDQVIRAQDWLRGLGRQEHYRGMQRVDDWIVPEAAFRECVVNAVAHRDYSILGSKVLVEVFDDRISVVSPGSLPNHKRPESVLAGGTPRSRNEAIANHLLECGLMEQRGSGYPRIRRRMAEFNGTEPLLEHDREERWVRVTLRREA